MGADPRTLHVACFPLMAPGHMIPMLDLARLFTSRPNVRATIITTPLNSPYFTSSTENISLHVIPFPSVESGVLEGVENVDQITSIEVSVKFLMATKLFESPLAEFLETLKPDCLIADMFFPWATKVASKFNIPRLVFHGTSCFALCATSAIMEFKPHLSVSSEDEEFRIPNFPGKITMKRSHIYEDLRENRDTEMMKMLKESIESEISSYGVVINSFYELERVYADHYREVLGRKAWQIGPVSLCNKDIVVKSQRGKRGSIDNQDCLKWLDSKNPNSVIYVCFGSLTRIEPSQLQEIAMGLESSGVDFIWVVRITNDNEEVNLDWWIDFEKRVTGKGLIIKGWAPQIQILEHEATGGFLTHCGWNSTAEAVAAGVPMITWPTFAEQFFNEKLVIQVLNIGVAVGAEQWKMTVVGGVGRERIAAAIQRLMVGEEATEMRNRAKKLAEAAKMAVEEGGSSFNELNSLIQHLSSNIISGGQITPIIVLERSPVCKQKKGGGERCDWW